MSLPPNGSLWPPPPHDISLRQQEVWSAWLVGDPDELTATYSRLEAGLGGSTRQNSFEPRTDGGLINRVAKFFWSRPSGTGQRKARLHVPLAADICTASADLLFSEPPQFALDEPDSGGDGTEGATVTDSPAKTRIDEVLNDGNFHAELIEAAELCAGLGGAWLRLVWDKETSDHVMIEAVDADNGIGEWRGSDLLAVTFFTEYRTKDNDQEVIRHLERHEPGAVLHGLYRGDPRNLGTAIPLTEHYSTKNIAGPDVNLEGGVQVTIPTGVKGLTAAYVANMRPQRRWRKVTELRQLGRSDYDGVEPLMDALDETYTSWMRDVRLARSRLIVPEFMLQDLGPGAGAAFDQDQEVFTQLKIAPTAAGAVIIPQQFIIRVAEHRDTADALIDQILDAAGYSPATFGRGGEAAATATEVVSKERKSARTRDKKTRYWSQALEPLLSTWLELDGIVYGGGYKGEVCVEWADESQPDMESLSRTLDSLNRAESISTDTKVRMLHPDWDEEQIAAEVEAITGETGRNVPDIGPIGTVPPNGNRPVTTEELAAAGLV